MYLRKILFLFLLLNQPLMAEPKASTQSSKQASTIVWTSIGVCFIVGISIAVIIAVANKNHS